MAGPIHGWSVPKFTLSISWPGPAERAAGLCVKGRGGRGGLGTRPSDKALLASVPLGKVAHSWQVGGEDFRHLHFHYPSSLRPHPCHPQDWDKTPSLPVLLLGKLEM